MWAHRGRSARWRSLKLSGTNSRWIRGSMPATQCDCHAAAAASWMHWSMQNDLQTHVHTSRWTTIFLISLGISGRDLGQSEFKRIRVENLKETGFDHPSDDTGHALPFTEQKEPLTPTCCLAILSRLQNGFTPYMGSIVAVSNAVSFI